VPEVREDDLGVPALLLAVGHDVDEVVPEREPIGVAGEWTSVPRRFRYVIVVGRMKSATGSAATASSTCRLAQYVKSNSAWMSRARMALELYVVAGPADFPWGGNNRCGTHGDRRNSRGAAAGDRTGTGQGASSPGTGNRRHSSRPTARSDADKAQFVARSRGARTRSRGPHGIAEILVGRERALADAGARPAPSPFGVALGTPMLSCPLVRCGSCAHAGRVHVQYREG